MSTTSNQTSRSRRPAGTPTGGQFAPETHAEPDVAISTPSRPLPTIGDPTPWGEAQSVEPVGTSMCWVLTASHGGLYVDDALNGQIDRVWRVDGTYDDNGTYLPGGWYEEDCDWAVPVVTFPDRFTPRTVLGAHGVLARWYPEFYRDAAVPHLTDNEHTSSLTGVGLECRSPDGRLHRRDQAAVQFRDGTSAWYVHGWRMPAPGSVKLSGRSLYPSVGESTEDRERRLAGIAAVLPHQEVGPDYDRAVATHVSDAIGHLRRGDLDAAEHHLVVARHISGHLSDDEAVAYDPWNWPGGTFDAMEQWITDPVGMDTSSIRPK